jgi:hypothetical protein
MPTLTIAGVNRDSNWSVNELRKLPGWKWKRRVINIQFITNRVKLRKKKMRPMTVNH